MLNVKFSGIILLYLQLFYLTEAFTQRLKATEQILSNQAIV